MSKLKTWFGQVPDSDDFNQPITECFIDGKTIYNNKWAIMTPSSHRKYGVGLGQGKGRKYIKGEERWFKVEG